MRAKGQWFGHHCHPTVPASYHEVVFALEQAGRFSAVGPEDLILRGSQHRTMSGRVTLENVRAWDET